MSCPLCVCRGLRRVALLYCFNPYKRIEVSQAVQTFFCGLNRDHLIHGFASSNDRLIAKPLHDSGVGLDDPLDLVLGKRLSPTLRFAAPKESSAFAFVASFAKAGFLFSLLQPAEIGLGDRSLNSLAIRIPTEERQHVAECDLSASEKILVADDVDRERPLIDPRCDVTAPGFEVLRDQVLFGAANGLGAVIDHCDGEMLPASESNRNGSSRMGDGRHADSHFPNLEQRRSTCRSFLETQANKRNC